jgi:hypothetical protein
MSELRPCLVATAGVPLKIYHHCPNGEACSCTVVVDPPELADRLQLIHIPADPQQPTTMRVNIRHSDEWTNLEVIE